MICPRCGKKLQRDETHNAVTFSCSAGCGNYMTLAGLRACGADNSTVNTLWSNARNGNAITGLPCPNCRQNMRQLKLGDREFYFDLDVCTVCQAVWFDAGELTHIPIQPRPPRPAENPDLKNLEPITTGYDHLPDGDGPDKFWKYIPALMGLPVEQYSISYRRLPLLTLTTAFCCIAIYILTVWQGNAASVINNWGYIPAQWFRHNGLTVFSSMFLHSGIIHLFGNMYFLLMCGDNAEDVLGHGKFLLLMLLSGLSAKLLYSLTTTQPEIPLVGASGFISGIIAFYAIMFPRQNFSCWFGTRYFFLALHYNNFFFTIPVWVWFSIYALTQLLYASLGPYTNVAYTSHLGGFIPGIIWALIERYKIKRSENQIDFRSVE